MHAINVQNKTQKTTKSPTLRSIAILHKRPHPPFFAIKYLRMRHYQKAIESQKALRIRIYKIINRHLECAQNDNKRNPNANNAVSWSATKVEKCAFNGEDIQRTSWRAKMARENGIGRKKNRRKKMLIPIIFIVLYFVHGKCG